MELFGKKEIKSLAAIKGLAAENVTAEHIDAINAEFAELGFGGIEVAIAGTFSEAATQLNTAADTISTHEATIAENTQTIAANQARITELEAENTELGKGAGAEASQGGKAEDRIETGNNDDPNKLANDMSAKIRAEKGL